MASKTSMYEQPLISVIVPVFNEVKYIRSFVQCLLQQDYPPEQTEFLLVDGGSWDGTLQLLQECASENSGLKILFNPYRFVPHALNIGLKWARGKVVVRMDVHAEYPPDYLSSLVYWLQETNADNVGGLWRTKPGASGVKASAIAKAASSPFGVGNAAYRIGVPNPVEVDTVPFGCYWARTFSRIGCFDEELLRNQDDEFNARLIQAGGKIVLLPQLEIDYYARSGLATLAQMMYQYGYYKPLVLKKVGSPATWRQFAPPLWVLVLILVFVLSWILPSVGYLLGSLCVAYLVFLILGGLHAVPESLREGLWTAGAMATMHFAYGWGYLRGVFAHWVFRRQAGTSGPTPSE